MNPDLFRQAQAEVAESVLQGDLAPHAKGRKLAALASAGVKGMVMPAVAAVGLLIGAGASTDANAQQSWSSWNPGAATVSQQEIEYQRAQEQMRRRQLEMQQREAQQREYQQRQADQQSTRVMADVVSNVLGQVAFGQGGNYNQARQAEQLGRTGVNVALGQDGKTTTQRLAIGATVGAAVSGLSNKNPKQTGTRVAVGAALGAAGGYVWDQVASRQTQQTQYQQGPSHVVSTPAGAYGGGSIASAGQQRQLVVYDAASLGLPAVMVEVARQSNMGVVAPGSRPVPLHDQAEIRRDPHLDNTFRSLSILTDKLGDRGAIVMHLDNLRSQGGNQMEIGKYSQMLVTADQNVRRQIKTSMDMINKAAAVGGYDTRPILEMTGNVVAKGYIPDSSISFRPNTQYGQAPRF